MLMMIYVYTPILPGFYTICLRSSHVWESKQAYGFVSKRYQGSSILAVPSLDTPNIYIYTYFFVCDEISIPWKSINNIPFDPAYISQL